MEHKPSAARTSETKLFSLILLILPMPFRKIVLLLAFFVVNLSGAFAQPKQPGSTPLSIDDRLEQAHMLAVDSADDRPTFSLDGKEMFFGSRRFSRDPWRVPDDNPQWKWDSDLWKRVWLDSVWSAPINLGTTVNNSAGQINPTVHPRGDIVYFVSAGNGTVWQAKLKDGIFQDPKPVGGEINGIYSRKSLLGFQYMQSVRNKVLKEMVGDSDLRVRAPDAYELHFRERMAKHFQTRGAIMFAQQMIRCESAVSPDGKYVVFSENFGEQGKYGLGGTGWEDLWVANINPQGGWDSVRQLLNINTEYEEIYPFIAADGETLYFTSNRICPTCPPGTSGGEDIYISRFTSNGPTAPRPLGPPFNTSADDYGFSIGPDGHTAYFVSNRSGKSLLYKVELTPADSAVAPKPVYIVTGKVVDVITKRPLKAEIFVDDLDAEQTKFSVISDSVTGLFALALQRGHRFGLQAISGGHLPRSEKFYVPGSEAFDRSKLDLELAPIEVGAITEFQNVTFETGKATLKKESLLELDRVVDVLLQHKATEIEIQGHTDDVGSSSYNQRLSLSRANAVRSYLITKGVNPSRLKAKGFGMDKPLAEGTSEEARAKNRRVEMVVTK